MQVVDQAPSSDSICTALADMRSSYEASRETKFLQPPPDMPRFGVGADYHTRIEQDFWYMLEFARHIERNDPVVPQGVARFACNIVQDGYCYKPETGVDVFDRLLKERWLEWSSDDNRSRVDFHMKSTWNEIERLTVRRIVFDGDIGLNPTRDGRLQPLEAHRIRSPLYRVGSQYRRRRYVVHGVEQNRQDQVVRYWVNPDEHAGHGLFAGRDYSGKERGVMAWEYDPLTERNEPNFFHLYMPHRFNQTRGVTTLAPVLNTVGMHGDVQFAKLVQQQMASYVAFIHEVPFSSQDYVPPEQELVFCRESGQMVRKAPDLSPGAEYWGQYPGEQIKPFSAAIPNAEFFDHAKLLLTFISLSLGMPLILFLLDAGETNFSAWRGAFDMAKLQFKEFQRLHSSRLHRQVFRWKMRRWMRQDAGLRRAYSVLGDELMRHSWQFPGWPYVEPLKDVQADAAEIAANLNSPRRIAARRKLEYSEVIKETCEDRAELILHALDAAAELNRHPYIVANQDEKVTWREISHPVLPDGLQMQILDKNDESSEERSPKSAGEGAGAAA